jgi:hypothetical protein
MLDKQMEVAAMKGNLGFGMGEDKSSSPEAAAVCPQDFIAWQIHVFRASEDPAYGASLPGEGR